jgi:hypothetical protein
MVRQNDVSGATAALAAGIDRTEAARPYLVADIVGGDSEIVA